MARDTAARTMQTDSVQSFVQSTLLDGAVVAFLVYAAAWLARTMLSERLKASVRLEVDAKLEAIKADFKDREVRLQAELKAQDTRLQAELRTKDQQLQLLQSGVLSARASRQSALDARRFDAIDKLWAAFNELAQYRVAAQLMETIKYDTALPAAANDPRVREFFQSLAKIVKMDGDSVKNLPDSQAWKARLYVTDEAWKLFTVYRGVLHILVIRLKQLENGLGKDFTKIKEAIDEVKAALPHQVPVFDEHGDSALAFMIDELGTAFERALLGMLRDETRSEDELKLAAALMSTAQRFLDANASSVETPTA